MSVNLDAVNSRKPGLVGVDTSSGNPDGEIGDISVFTIGTFLLRHRRAILVWMIVTAVVAVTPVILRKSQYTAQGSFILRGGDSPGSSLSALAGQFGFTLPSSTSALQSPQFYADLLRTREFLAPIASDTFQLAGRQTTVPQLFGISGQQRDENSVAVLSKIVSASVARQTGVVAVSASTPWPNISLQIVRGLMDRVNDFNLKTLRLQVGAERKFTEQRVSDARAALRQAEDRLKNFLQSNRVIGSAELRFDQDRLESEVALLRSVYNSLAQANEEMRIRELRDTPVITVVESPWVSSLADPRGRLSRALLGLALGALLGIMISLVSEMLAKRRASGDPRVEEFYVALKQMRPRIFGSTSARRAGSGG